MAKRGAVQKDESGRTPSAARRKLPRQERARHTVDAILTATLQIISTQGYGRATTNHIARTAGVSIGSLYQYFPSKEALLTALSQRHAEQMVATLKEKLAHIDDLPTPEAIREVIRAEVSARSANLRLHQVLLREVPRLAGTDHMVSADEQIRQMLLDKMRRRREELRPCDLELASFILVRGISAITQTAVLERPEILNDSLFLDELVYLVLSFLARPGQGRAASG